MKLVNLACMREMRAFTRILPLLLIAALLCSCENKQEEQMATYVQKLVVAKTEQDEARQAELIRTNAKGAGLKIFFMDGFGNVVDFDTYYALKQENPKAKSQLLFIVGCPVRVAATRMFLNQETAAYLLLPK